MENNIVLMEAASSVYKRKYACPYCDEKYEKVKLVSHIDKKHSECIPEGFTATRIVFNIVNKKEKGKCVICGKESPWNEDKARYDRFCSDKCKKEYEKIAAERLKRVRGMTKEEMLKDIEYQNNVMLANRKISGKYKFQDGTIRTYVGSYELKFLEFMDKFFNVKSEDLETPGPIIEYKYRGETHKWITDAYYAPYNLVFDIKDGGDNPNKAIVDRERQTCKENAIKKQGKYNYIRLTDNKFEQLIELMLELKELYIENNGEYTPIVRINESTILEEGKKAKDLGPKVCTKCGSKNIGVFLKGEPIYQCKDCGQYLGTVPFNEAGLTDSHLVNVGGYWKLTDEKVNINNVSWDEEQTYPTINHAIRFSKINMFGEDRYVYRLNPETYKVEYMGLIHISDLGNDDEYTIKFIEKTFDKVSDIVKEEIVRGDLPEPKSSVSEACKDLQSARKFVSDVRKVAKKYDANFFIVTDGASGYSNQGNPAVRNARDSQIEWEKKHGFDPYEDWSGTIESSNINEVTVIKYCNDKPSQDGFMNNGSWNSIRTVDGETYRERVECIIFNKELDKVLIGTNKEGYTKLPGGGTDKNKTLEEQLAKECQEEVRINIDNIKYIGAYGGPNPSYIKDNVYKGHYTYLYFATYDSDYKDYIRPEDQDSLKDRAKWVDFYDAKKLLKERSADLYFLFNNECKSYIEELSKYNI